MMHFCHPKFRVKTDEVNKPISYSQDTWDDPVD